MLLKTYPCEYGCMFGKISVHTPVKKMQNEYAEYRINEKLQKLQKLQNIYI